MKAKVIVMGLMAEIVLANAEKKAEIRYEAPFKAAEAKQGFVRGAGPKPVAPSHSSVSAAMTENQRRTQLGADRSAQDARSLYSSAGSMLSSGLKLATQTYTPSAAGGAPTIESPYQGGDGSYIPGDTQS